MIDAAVAEYLEAVRTGWDDLLRVRRPLDPLDTADGSRYLAAIVEGAMTFVHGDAARPVFVPWTTADRRWADNGRDSAYWWAPLDGRHRYRISGVRGEECYLSFTVYGGTPGHPETVVTNVNHRDLGAGNGEPYELEIDPPEDACYVIARQYFLRPDVDHPATLGIENSGDTPPAIEDEATLAARWEAAAGFVPAMTRPPITSATPPAYVSTIVNEMGDPSGWRADEGGGRGTPDQTYALGRFELETDQALVMDVEFPPCVYASAALWNRYSQSIDARHHRSTLNQRQVSTGSDGVSRLVVAHHDPGVPDWLDTGGRRRGTVFWRFLLSDEAPPPIRCSVLPLDEVTER